MCDYCDCRSVELIDRLGRDHAELQAQAGTIRKQALIGDLPEARRSLAHLVADLERHTKLEEGALFPAMRDSGMAPTATSLGDDHREIEHLVAEAAAACDAEWPSIAVELLAVLGEHIRREEYDVFPAAVQLVPSARWDAAHHTVVALSG